MPLLLAHQEGIVIDVTGGKKFFTKSQHKADVVDPTQLVSIESALAALQATYGEDVKDTQTEGSLSRHGVLHGRELAYDTRLNSAKTWSVMDALVEWAFPKAREVVDVRRAERQQANAGSDELDDRGRRVDDREFAETRKALLKLDTAAMGWHRQRSTFRDDLVGAVYDADDFVKCGLPVEHDTQQLVRADGQEVAYWRETVSGWVLGRGLVWDGEHFLEYMYAAPHAPNGLATERGAGWGALWESPPDWT